MRSSYNQLLLRIITTIIAGIPVLICTFYGSVVFLILIIVLTMLSINEFYYMLENKRSNYSLGIIANAISVMLVSSSFFNETKLIWKSPFIGIITFFLLAFYIWEVFKKKIYASKSDLLVMLRVITYIGITYSYLILLRECKPSSGFHWMIYLITTIWLNDAIAYILGIKFGKHKLSPDISPNKSIEGSLAGLTAGIIWSLFLSKFIGISILHAIVLGCFISILAQIGDLSESLLKRKMQVKDSGSLLPGHGGVLDRMDSFILTVPVLYYYLLFFNLY